MVPQAAGPEPDARSSDARTLGLWQVASIGIGGMVGGGIFAVLGLSASISRGGAPIAFLVAGGVAALTAYSYSRLSSRYPDRGGTITFLNEAFGGGALSGGLNLLLWLSYIVMLSLYASAFGSYFASLLPADAPGWSAHVALSAVIIGLTALNGASAASVGRAEEWIVAAKLAILAVFVVVGMTAVVPARLAPSQWNAPLSILGGGMLIFIAFEGFELIANAGEDARNAETLRLAYGVSVSVVTILYVLVAAVTVGVLSPDQIATARDFALAEAARPRLGQMGFTVIAVAALLSTASAINATLYGATRLTYVVARSGELPAPFRRSFRGGIGEGLLITSALTLIVANTVDLSRIATMGSAGFLIVFGAVNFAQFRLRSPIDPGWLPIAGVAACVLALAALFAEVGTVDPAATAIAGGLVVVAFASEAAYRAATGRSLTHRYRPHRRR